MALAALLLAACGGPSNDVDQQDIQGGRRDGGHPAVGLVSVRGGPICTGTLIAPQVVLTAAHCVREKVVSFSTVAVDRQAAAPSYLFGSCPNHTGDVALLHLSRPLAGVAPLELALRPPAAGATCTAVGFGTSAQKRSASETVVASDDSVITVHAGSGIAASGDSGGPLLCGGAIAGTVGCHEDSAPHVVEYYARVDAVRPWIERTVAEWR